MKKSNIVTFSIVFLIMAGSVVYLFFGDTAVRQMIMLRKGNAWIEANKNAITENYKDIQIITLTNLSFLVSGEIDKMTELDGLAETVEKHNPPMPVHYRLKIREKGWYARGSQNFEQPVIVWEFMDIKTGEEIKGSPLLLYEK